MRPEYLLLNIARAVIVVEIETGLAYANDPGMFGKRGQLIGRCSRVLGRFMGMSSYRAPHVVARFGDGANRRELIEPGADRQHCTDVSRPGAREDRIMFAGEIRKIEMAMAVDQHAPCPHPAAASLSTNRGKMPRGAGMARPGGRLCSSSAKLRASAGTAS